MIAQGLTIDGLRRAVIHTRQKLNTSDRRTCAVLSVSRSSIHDKAKVQDDDGLRLAMVGLAKQYGRYGYRKISELLRIECLRSIYLDWESWLIVLVALAISFALRKYGRTVLAIVSGSFGLLLAVTWAYSVYELNCVELVNL